MNKQLLLMLTVALFIGSKLNAYCFYSDENTKENLEVLIFKNQADLNNMYKTMQVQGAIKTGLETGFKIAASFGAPSIPLAQPLDKVISFLAQAALVKARFNLGGGKPAQSCWNWADIRKAGAFTAPYTSKTGQAYTAGAMFALVVNKDTNAMYDSIIPFDIRGYVRIQIKDGKLLAAVVRYTGSGTYPYALDWATPGIAQTV